MGRATSTGVIEFLFSPPPGTGQEGQTRRQCHQRASNAPRAPILKPKPHAAPRQAGRDRSSYWHRPARTGQVTARSTGQLGRPGHVGQRWAAPVRMDPRRELPATGEGPWKEHIFMFSNRYSGRRCDESMNRDRHGPSIGHSVWKKDETERSYGRAASLVACFCKRGAEGSDNRHAPMT